jgi:hypothetical protein
MKRRPERKQWLLFREGQQEKRDQYVLNIIIEHISCWLDSQGIELLE